MILDAHPQAPSVPLFNRLKWLPFYDDAKITLLCFAFRRTRRTLPTYLDELLKLNSEQHERKVDTLILTLYVQGLFVKLKEEGCLPQLLVSYGTVYL